MKTIIRLSVIIVLIITTSESLAQTFVVKAGFNLSNMFVKNSEVLLPYNNTNGKYRMNPGFHFGGVAEFRVGDLFTIESGLLFTTRGTILVTKEPFGSTTLVTKDKHNLYYLDIPLTAKVPFSIGECNFYGSFGAYGGIGLIGNIKTKATFGDLVETEKRSIKWGLEGINYDLRRLDYGLTFGAGIILNSFQVGLSYNLGLANISPVSAFGYKISNRVLGISVGYMFGENGKSETANLKAEKRKEERISGNKTKSNKEPSVKSGGRKAARLEAERLRIEKIRADSIAAARAEQERIQIAKVRADSIEAVRVIAEKIEAERINLERIKADSIAAARKEASIKVTKEVVVYRVQFVSNNSKKGSYNISIGGKNYTTWEYFYNGAYRSTVGEFKTIGAANALQKILRQSGYPQAFVVAFTNNVRTMDPALFK
jgi:hypothetical protein